MAEIFSQTDSSVEHQNVLFMHANNLLRRSETNSINMKRNRDLIPTSSSRKRVSIAAFATMILIEPMTRVDIEAMWYTRDEMAKFKANGRMELQARKALKIAVLCRRFGVKDKHALAGLLKARREEKQKSIKV